MANPKPKSLKPPTVPPGAGPSGDLPAATAGADRRGFLRKAAAVAIGGLVTLFPFAAGLFVFADPLRRRTGRAEGIEVPIARLDAVPDDGVPRQFPVLAGHADAWNYFPNEAIGAVFLRREKDRPPEAFQTTCPHAGCMINYLPSAHVFKCPCHNSAFKLDGEIIQPSPSPRPMDRLPCEVREVNGTKMVVIRYLDFYTGIAEKKERV